MHLYDDNRSVAQLALFTLTFSITEWWMNSTQMWVMLAETAQQQRAHFGRWGPSWTNNNNVGFCCTLVSRPFSVLEFLLVCSTTVTISKLVRKGLSCLPFHVIVFYWRRTGRHSRQETRDRNWNRGHGGILLTGWLLIDCSQALSEAAGFLEDRQVLLDGYECGSLVLWMRVTLICLNRWSPPEIQLFKRDDRRCVALLEQVCHWVEVSKDTHYSQRALSAFQLGIKMWDLSSSCCLAFALPPWTQTLWNCKLS